MARTGALGRTVWMTALIDFCLLVNLLITIVMFLLLTEPEAVARWARRRAGGEGGWFDEPTSPPEGVAVAKLWARWMWVVLVSWGLLTGFLIGLYWQGWFWRF